MLCYKDMTFCSSTDCVNMDCKRNTKTIDNEHMNKVGLPLALSDFQENCVVYQAEQAEV